MLKHDNGTKKFLMRVYALLLCAACLILCFSDFFTDIFTTSASASYTITFTQGTENYLSNNTTDTIFSDTTTSVTTNASGCLVVPETYFNIYSETAGTGELAISVSVASSNILDCETFYLYNTTAGASAWYSFTGWHIVGTDDKIPEQTIFQPGDVITPDILSTYASSGTLTLEALWGKCYFIQNAYATMVYTQNSSGVYELNTTSSSGVTGASDDYTGLDPKYPKATIDGLYKTLTFGIDTTYNTTNTTKSAAFVDHDAYATVIMLTGDLNYYKDNNMSTSYNNVSTYYLYYGYDEYSTAANNGGYGANTEYVSATYKSLQATRTYNGTNDVTITNSLTTKGTKYNYYYKGRGSYSRVYGNLRFDNILFRKTKSGDIGNVTTSEFQLYYPSDDTDGLHYFEATARYNVYTENGSNAYLTYSEAGFHSFRTADHQYIVLNGGQYNNMEYYWATENANISRYWYIGRLAYIQNYITMGSTSTAESVVITSRGNMTLTITGGRIGYITGSSKGMNAISVGNRTLNIYGNGSVQTSGGTLSQMASYEYSPYIYGLYGGGYTSPLYGDVTITAENCNNLVSVYGGGQDYSATTYGNVTLNITNCTISGSLYGGGMYANVEKIPSEYIQYSYDDVLSSVTQSISNLDSTLEVDHGGDVKINLSGTTVGKSVYGSGMGQTQTITVSTSLESHMFSTSEIQGGQNYTQYYYPTNWTTEPTFPTYDTNTGYVLIGSYKYITYTSASPSAIAFRRNDYYAYLSLATVQNVEINITDGSLVYGDVYGGGSIAKVLGNTAVNIEDSTVRGTVYGGGDGATTPSTVTVYQSGNGNDWTYYVASYDTTTNLPTSVVCSGTYTSLTRLTVLGTFTWSGDDSLKTSGIDTTSYLLYSANTSDLGAVYGNTTVTIKGNSTVGTVYGGGNQGAVYGNITVTVCSTTNGTPTITTALYGGCNAADVGDDINNTGGNITVTVTDSTISNVYGGNNTSGSVRGTIAVTVSETSSNATKITNLYGGGNKAAYEGNSITVTIGGGTFTNVYGGGLSADVTSAYVYINGGTIASLFGGGSDGAATTTNVTVTSGTVNYLYGGGKNGSVSSSTNVTISGGTMIGLYGGGYGSTASVTTANVSISAGSISTIYGGGFQGATGATNVSMSGGSVTNALYGGGNAGAVGTSDDTTAITVSVTGGTITTLYGGCNAANVYGHITVSVTDATITSLYGGNNVSGTISGSVGVTVSQGSGTTTIGTLYGGGNAADYGGTCTVTVNSGTIGTLYGGGLSADVGNTEITMAGTVTGSMYGGGYAGAVTGNTTVTVSSSIGTGTSGGSIYGGGYNGAVGGTTTVTVSGSVGSGSTGNIYGGGYNGAVAGAASVTLNGGSVTGNVFGGGYGTTATVASASVGVTNSGTVTGSIYGGGENGDVTGNAIVAVNGTVTGSIYGGGLNGNVGGTTTVTVSGGTVGSVYGGGYDGDIGTSASASSTTVTVTGGTMTSVYGGGYNGDIYGKTAVTISGTTSNITITISGSVYGAGYGEESCVTEGTTVTIDLTYSFTATEALANTGSVTSGEITTTIEEGSGTYSVINGNVYGGGNLGTVGAGTINTSTNTATVTSAATTSVTVKSGHIEGSVYGGGYGVPESGTYNIYMGTVFGQTTVVIGGSTCTSSDYVYIVGNVFGGGSQSRVYTSGNTAATVTISSASGCNIALGGSVFGGGERGNSATTNASVATTIGNVSVNITGNGETTPATIYFVKGGVYGDGNLCLVSGTRTITITNLTCGSRTSTNLKTFYSLQRADSATLSNTQIVLLGAVDLVAEGDDTTYSINRIDTLNLTNGSTIKLDRIVNYLGALTSDVEKSRSFINGGYNGTNTYNSGASISALQASEISSYITCAIIGDQFNGSYTNMVCVANGLSLELRNTNGGYGTVSGLFTLSLLYANEGEGGGFVYADIANSTGDFICITGYADSYTEVSGLDATTFAQGIYYTRELVGSDYVYTKADSFSNTATYYKRNYMTVVDDVGGYVSGNTYTYYYWYIQGSTINYTLEVTGYIGSTVTDYNDSGTVPKHTATRYYVLHDVSVNDTLSGAVTGNTTTYELVQTSSNLTGQQISIEVMIGSTSLGFLYYDTTNNNYGWGLYVDSSTTCYGTGTTGNGSKNLEDNILTANGITVENGTDSIYFVLHKSTDVTTETSGMTIAVNLYIYEQDGSNISNMVSGGTSQLVVKGTANVVRLVPTQTIYKTTGKNYAGIDTSATSIDITTGSSFTVQYQTKYIPAAFTSTATTPIVWALSAEGFAYYTDASGNYLTINTTTSTCAGISSSLTYSGETSPASVSLWTVYKDTTNNNYYYYTSYTSPTDNTKVTMNDNSSVTYESTIPAGTKITMIDMTSGSAVYYYYICSSATTNINLDSFMVMGSTTTISSLATTPAYKAAYDASNANSQVTENLIFIFDFENATGATGTFRVQLQHMYSETDTSYAIDMMDFVQSSTDGNNTSYTRTVPQPVVYTITDTNGLTLEASFEEASYYDIDTAVLKVIITEDTTYINTRLSENEYAIKIELVSSDGTTVYSFPVGMQFQYVYNGEIYTISASGTYVIIPIKTSGTHYINIINELFSLKDIVGATAYFRVTLYSAPDASYYNNIKWCSTDANSLSYGINTNLTYALSVTAATGTTTPQVLTAGDTLNFTVKTSCSGSSTEGVTVTLMKKNDNGVYETVDLSSLFTNSGSISASTSGADYGWTVSSTADTGTYRLVFTYGDHTEYLNVIVY